MAWGSLPLTAWRTSSSEDTVAVSKPACSRLALTRTACSRSSVVMRTRSAMSRLRAGDQIHGVIEELGQHRQPFLHSIRRAGEIDDQGLAASTGAALGD